MKTNFETPLLFAQQRCREAIFEAARYLETLMDFLEKKGYVKQYTITVEPFNVGYLIHNQISWNHSTMMSHKVEKLWNRISNLVYIQPEVFFNEHYQNRQARIEMCIFGEYKKVITLNYNQIGETCLQFAYCIFEICSQLIEESFPEETITCPHCKTTAPYENFEAINSDYSSTCEIKCPHCGKTFLL